MANRPKGYGMTAELANKKAAKFDADLANEAMAWIAEVLAEAGDEETAQKVGAANSAKDVQNALKDGVVLCHLANAIKPGAIKKVNVTTMAFKQMENINNFLAFAYSINAKTIDMFQTVDLYEGQNIPQVVNGIYAFARRASVEFGTLPLGPEEATEHKREFTEEQLRAGEGIIGLQAGSNKGASQSGQNFGKTRAIID